MTLSVPHDVVDRLLLGPPDNRRQLQDSPILGDVWIAFANDPAGAQDLLITPHKDDTASQLAVGIEEQLDRDDRPEDDPEIAYLQGVVVAKLRFEEILRVVVPMTGWWKSERTTTEFADFLKPEEGRAHLLRTIADALGIVRAQRSRSPNDTSPHLSGLQRHIALAGLILWAGTAESSSKETEATSPERRFDEALKTLEPDALAELLTAVFERIGKPKNGSGVFQVSLNRRASPALRQSVPAVKGDAARNLFSVDCSEITWAVIDSGIDGSHPAFAGADGKSRVVKTFDFKRFRRIVSLGNAKPKIRERNLEALGEGRSTPLGADADAALQELAQDCKDGRPVNWIKVERLIEVDDAEPPPSDHGTHVAGIIGASRQAQLDAKLPKDDHADGMCPDIRLYDFRVLAPSIKETEFAIIGAMQYIRHLNERHRFITIHGVNLSLSIPHDVRNFACGSTPVCLEAEQLVESGIVAVAAAGNLGYHSFRTAEGSYEGYAAFSVTDPGNTDGVITVGSTHRHWPHTYGVSFFSSRGPTGDGRPKPDLVAPGERIRAPIRNGQLGDLDGTSMAAPHVSGAAAMLMARYSELIGQPRRIKQILCNSATDLGRERAFQGHGMLDVLRAFQSV